jgi:hypothetical protein
MVKDAFGIDWPPVIPPQIGNVTGAPSPTPSMDVTRAPRTSTRGGALLSNVLCFWRSRREKRLREKLAWMRMQLSLEREEKKRLADIIENLSQWVMTSTAAATRLQVQLGAPPTADDGKKRRNVALG